MKTKNFFISSVSVFMLAATSLFIVSCQKDKSNDMTNNNGDAKTYTLSGSASGSQENPPATTNGSASLSGTYYAADNKMNYTINWTGLSGPASVVQIYGPAAAGSNADAIMALAITTNGINGSSSGSVILSDAAETYLLSGNVYYNILTSANPSGELRGQISAITNK